MAVDREELFRLRLDAEDYEIPGVGVVRLRALSRAEVLAMRDKELPIVEMDRKLIAAAMVDPTMTEDQVRQWQEACMAGELEPITEAIMRLSGLELGAAKEAMKRFRE